LAVSQSVSQVIKRPPLVRSSFVVHCSLFVVRSSSFVVCCSSFLCRSFVVPLSFVVRRSSLLCRSPFVVRLFAVRRRSPFAVRRSSFGVRRWLGRRWLAVGWPFVVVGWMMLFVCCWLAVVRCLLLLFCRTWKLFVAGWPSVVVLSFCSAFVACRSFAVRLSFITEAVISLFWQHSRGHLTGGCCFKVTFCALCPKQLVGLQYCFA